MDNNNLKYMKAIRTSVNPPLPYRDNEFDAIISISIFTHLTEKKQDEFLSELHRICYPGGSLFLTVHGELALNRAITERSIRDMILVEEIPFQEARKEFAQNRHAFILQNGHLTTVQRNHWGKWFEIIDYRHGAIHNFQDIVVLTPRK